MTLVQVAQSAWHHRVRCYTALIVWISVRYLIIGIEYALRGASGSPYWANFADVNPVVVGSWIALTGLVGIISQLKAWYTGFANCSLLRIFAMGVTMHSLFRMTLLLQHFGLADPLFVLFVCDFVAAAFILLGLPHGKKSVFCV